MDFADIILTVPEHLVRDFLGIVAVDILHDAKGRGFLAGKKLSQITDLLAFSISLHNELVNEQVLKTYVFKMVLEYFLELWNSRIDALGLTEPPNLDNNNPAYWEHLRETVTLPLRKVADRDTEDVFFSLGTNKLGVESQNYQDQKDKLSGDCAEMLAFISPKGIYKTHDYFTRAIGIIDIIKHRLGPEARVALDMKSSAGLIRTITDPIGYLTGLPTFADPGYNMPGMSAIRQHAEIAFVSETASDGCYRQHPNEFRYEIVLMIPNIGPLVFLDVRYYYGVAIDGLDRNNLMISILDHTFSNTLPHSTTMADTLGRYLSPRPSELKMTVSEVIDRLKDIIIDYYNDTRDHSNDKTRGIYEKMHAGYRVKTALCTLLKTELRLTRTVTDFIAGWIGEKDTVFRTSYILATLTNLTNFNIRTLCLKKADCILPETMITEHLPSLLFNHQTTLNYSLLAFCYHQYLLLKQFIDTPMEDATYQQELARLLNSQWLPNRKGKVVTQINRLVRDWQKKLVDVLESEEFYVKTYLQQILGVCNRNLNIIANNGSAADPFLQLLPIFQPSSRLRQALTERLHFYNPVMYNNCVDFQDGLLLSELLKNKAHCGVDLHRELSVSVPPDIKDAAYDALCLAVGKFSGDFGQIMWCMKHGHIFASEDNNASAMALLLHRLPADCINVGPAAPPVWGNIHGLGDGGSVDVILDRARS